MWIVTAYVAVVTVSVVATFIVITRGVLADMARLEQPPVPRRDMARAA